MRTEIYIENQSLDLYKDISAEFTYNIDDVKDFSSRNTNFSKTIVIPGNATNNKLFGHIFEFGNSNFYNPTADNVGYNFNAAKSAACVVYVDKIQIFKGIIRLLEIIIDNGSIEYECAVFGELGGFVSAIANGKIEDLDFSAYNHVWNVTNITNSWNQVDGSGYFYPLIDYGQVSVSKKDWQYKAFRPALFVREYIDKIITGAGYTWESSFFNTNLFKRLVIPNNQKDLSAYSTTAFKSDVLPKFDTTDYYAAAGSNIKLEYPSPSIAGSFTASLSNTRFTYTGASTISITVTATLNGSYEDSAETMYFVVRKNGTTDIATSPSVENLYDSFDFTFSGTGTFATNDYFEVIAIRQNNALDYRIFINSGNIELNTDVTQAVVLNRNELIQINKTIPRGVFQKDFFSSIVKMFNLYVTESTDKTKHLIISPYIDYYDFNDTIDWSLKIDRSKPFRLKPMSELNGRFFEYKYKQDADFYNENYFKKYNEGYGDFLEDTGYEFANDKQTAEIVFAATPLILYAGDDKVHSIILKRSNTQSNNPSEDKMDSVIRILQVKKITGVASYKIEDGTSNLLSTTTYGYGGHLDDPYTPAADINFGAPKEIYFTLSNPYPSANLFNGYWGDYVAEISDKDSKLLTCNVRLTDIDIYNLDFSRPIWIDGSLWRLNKVMDYNPMVEDTTKCEFIKVIEKTYA
jgi:hypothetical protein